MARTGIQDQIEAVIAVIESDGKTYNADALDAVVTTLMYLRDHRPEIELAAMIYKDPALKILRAGFPDARLVAVRPLGSRGGYTDPSYEDGGIGDG